MLAYKEFYMIMAFCYKTVWNTVPVHRILKHILSTWTGGQEQTNRQTHRHSQGTYNLPRKLEEAPMH